jgi:hypothetical protein
LICSGEGNFCFTENTPTESGELMVEKHAGDLIPSINPATGERFMATLKTVKRSLTTSLTRLMIAGSMMSLTPNHALQNEAGQWIEAQNLHAGDHLRSPQGIVEVEDACTETVPLTPVISFELENDASRCSASVMLELLNIRICNATLQFYFP